jgi:DnaD/phage-associated family protein
MAELIVGQVVSLSGAAVDKLLARGEGDAALLCLALLRLGEPQAARKALRWTDERTGQAWAVLAQLGLVADKAPEAESVPLESEQPPDYQRRDILTAIQEEPTFQGLYHAVERRLGKKLSDADLKALYEIYDYVALPVEVIVLLVTRCIEEFQEKYGPGRMPRMSLIKKTAYAWRRMGVDTAEAAEEFLKKQTRLQARERELLPLLDITGRPPVAKEREYLDAWVDMGFPNDAIRLAYERTVLKKQTLNWPYMNSILKSWHSKGLHTLAEIQAGDSDRRRGGKAPAAVAAASAQDGDERMRRDMERLERYARKKE